MTVNCVNKSIRWIQKSLILPAPILPKPPLRSPDLIRPILPIKPSSSSSASPLKDREACYSKNFA